MARLSSNSIFGPISGSLGGLVFVNRGANSYVRTKCETVSKPSSPAQLDQKAKFKAVVQFLKPLKDILRIGFKAHGKRKKMSAFNAAMAYHLIQALIGSYPEYGIDYSKVLVSKGYLSGAKDPAASLLKAGAIEFTWKDTREDIGNDMIMVVVYNPAKNEVIFIAGGTFRTEEHLTVQLPLTFAGDEVHCYIALQNARGSEMSDSEYLGCLVVS